MTAPLSLEALQPVIVRTFPELEAGSFTALPGGWDSFAIDVDDRLIFKFPRHAAAGRRLASEAALLAVIRPAVALPTPDMTLYDGTRHGGPPLFSRHPKLRGGYLEPAVYAALSETDRDRLAEDLARLYAELHALPHEAVAAAGAGPIQPWLGPDDILGRAWPILDAPLRRYAERIVTAWRALPPDPVGQTYGFFDGHGWNMAFDRGTQRLNGVYDFGDSGFGQLQQEFIYANMVSPDLAARIICRYAAMTGRALDAERIALLYQALRLSELAALAGDREKGPIALAVVRDLATT
ncbi:MAG TPA: aminoglycoside phosphotransferase family protein [Caulobacteraceae bacterium]|nr:aminoglycoside phosphotransferase family protein [Caulobacteraceae bacterium]